MLHTSRGANYCWFFFDNTSLWKCKHWYVCLCFKWKNTSKKQENTRTKKEASSLPNLVALPTNEIRDLFKRNEKRKEEKLWGQVNDNLNEDDYTIFWLTNL